jgi:hypothetical protein
MLNIHYIRLFLLLPIIGLGIASEAHAQSKSDFKGFFADAGAGYRSAYSSTVRTGHMVYIWYRPHSLQLPFTLILWDQMDSLGH